MIGKVHLFLKFIAICKGFVVLFIVTSLDIMYYNYGRFDRAKGTFINLGFFTQTFNPGGGPH